MSAVEKGYIRQCADLICVGEEVTVVGPAGYKYVGTFNGANYGLLRIITKDGTGEILLNPANVVSIQVKVAEA